MQEQRGKKINDLLLL